MNSLTLCVITLVTVSNCLQLPSSFKKCDRKRSDFNQCLSEAIHSAIKLLEKPLSSHGLPSLYDLEYPPDVAVEWGNRTYGLAQKYHKLRFIGLSKPEIITASWDFGALSSTLTIEATYSELKLEAECEAKGTIVLLPVNVITPVEYTYDNPTFTFSFELEEYEKGTTYFRVINSGLDAQAQVIKFDYKQFFSNRRLNDEFNSAMNAKSRQIFATFKHLEHIFAPLFGDVFNAFLENVPAAELFEG